MTAEYLVGKTLTCFSTRSHDRRFWNCNIGAVTWRGYSCSCDVAFSCTMVCDDFGNLVRVSQ